MKLHVANLPDCSLDHPDVLRKKFDLFGSVDDAEMIRSKHIGILLLSLSLSPKIFFKFAILTKNVGPKKF